MKTVRLTESSYDIVELTPDDAERLRRIGQALASQLGWWGDDDDVDGSSADTRTVVRCYPVSGSTYRVRVSDAIGVIGLQNVQLVVEPKIPLPHVLHLFSACDVLPRHSFDRSQLGSGTTFFSVIATWFVASCETLLRHGLASDYDRATGELACARGRIHTVATARALMNGRPRVRCDYDVRTEDTSLNRVLKAAALRLLGSPSLPSDLRARIRRMLFRFSDIGMLRPTDLSARPDALTRVYADAHPLAQLILAGTSLSMRHNSMSAWTFLFRTPDAIEEGVRSILSDRLGVRIVRSRKSLGGDRNRTINPDLVFGNLPVVGDVKYKVTMDGSIGRSDLYQAATFATGYGVGQAVVVGFGSQAVGERVRVGGADIRGFNWDVGQLDPEVSADLLANELAEWLPVVAR